MQTQQDHVHAYQTLVGRMSSALLRGDTNNGEQPARRTRLGLVLGLVVGLLAGAAFWIYGLIKPGGSTVWRRAGVVLVEKESGTRYVYRDGALRPVPNQASALLIQGAAAKIQMISRVSLADLPRGEPLGIPGAPDPVPARARLVRGPWLLCVPASGGLSLNLLPGGGAAPGNAPATVTDDDYGWVADRRGAQYLIWQHRKLPVADRSVPVALGLGTAPPPVAPDAWLGALPAGPAVGAAEIPSAGRAGPDLGGQRTVVGDLFQQETGAGAIQAYVMLADGLAPVGRTDFALLQARQTRPVRRLDPAAVAGARQSVEVSLRDRLPDLLGGKPVTTGDRVPCLRQHARGKTLSSEFVTVPRRAAGPALSGVQGALVPPAGGALVASIPAPTGPNAKPDRYLITDRGLRYRLRTDDAVAALGFGGVTPVPMAADVIAAIPAGPELSRAAVGVTEKT